MNTNEFSKKIRSIMNNPNELLSYATAASMLLYTIGYFIRALKK